MLARSVVPALTLMGYAVLLPGSVPAKTYYVDQSHPRASDENAGTEALPWKTINHAANTGTEIHDNLFCSDSLAGAWAGGVVETRIWNNIVISKARSITACENKRHELTSALAYMDYNVYDAPPVFNFGQYTPKPQRFSLGQMQSRGFEEHSRVVASQRDVFDDERSYRLLPEWKMSGRDGDTVGPEDIALILELSRYGPEAVRPSVSPKKDDR